MFIVDDAVSGSELSAWRALAQTGEQSTAMAPEQYEGTELFALASEMAPGPLIHGLLFDLKDGDETEAHRDVGEWAACFYPFDCASGPLWTEQGSVDVVANRLVMFDATTIEHRQVPPVGERRRSVVFKFRRAA